MDKSIKINYKKRKVIISNLDDPRHFFKYKLDKNYQVIKVVKFGYNTHLQMHWRTKSDVIYEKYVAGNKINE